MVLLLTSVALASTSATSFATDPGEWSGGVLGNGLLEVSAGSAELFLGDMESYTFVARLRVASGEAMSLTLGEGCTWTADYADAVSLGNDRAPFGMGELSFAAESTLTFTGHDGAGASNPELVSFNGQWWMFYDTTDSVGGSAIRGAVSADLVSFEPVDDFVIAGGSGADAVVADGKLVLTYAVGGAILRTVTGDGLSWEAATVALAPGPDFDASGLGHPSMVYDDAGGWHLWYSVPATGATGYATSADGVGFTRAGELSADTSRLYQSDVAAEEFGFESVYSLGDSLGYAGGGADPSFADAAGDLRPLLSSSSTLWAADGFGGPAWVMDGTSRFVFVDGSADGVRGVGRLVGAPVAGDWGTLRVEWDGVEAVATWNGGPGLACGLEAAETFVLATTGTVEIDEASVDFVARRAGDSGFDTGVPGDSGTLDSGEPEVPTTDSAALDTGVGAGLNAGQWLGDPGGFGCESTKGHGGGALLALLGWLVVVRTAMRTPKVSS